MSKQNQEDGLFWKKNEENNKVQIDDAALIDFLTENGFYKHNSSEKGYEIIRIKNNIIRKTGDYAFTEEVRDYLNSLEETNVFNAYLRRGGVNKTHRDALPYFNGKFIQDTQDTSFFYFQNGVVRVTAEDIRLIDYAELPGAVWEEEIINRKWGIEDKEASVFEYFVAKVSGEDSQRKEILESIIGYLLSNYKDPANARAIIFLDANISDDGKANGGSGKTLLGKAIGELRRVLSIDSKNNNNLDKFKFQQVQESTRIIFYDDVWKNFNFEEFYSIVTGGMQVEKKYKDAKTVPEDKSPKILISSNYIVKGTGGSSDSRRMLEFQFSDYFHEGHTPLDEFGKRFFDDWDEAEWTQFDGYMLYCVQKFLRNGLIFPDNKELERRKVENATSSKFYEFMLTKIPPKGPFDKAELLEEYGEYAGELMNRPSAIQFKRWLDELAEYHGYHVKHRKSNGKALVDLTPKG
jgi:hypothetical protein